MTQQPEPFPETFDRSGTGSVKWAAAGAESDPYRIPLGVADMDLPGFPELFTALRERMAHPVIGYTLPSPRSRELVAAWYRDRFGAAVDPDWILQLPFGPRTAVRFVLDAVVRGHREEEGGGMRPGPVLAPSPEYGVFRQVTAAAGLPYTEIPLERTGDGYRLPVEAFEEHAARSRITAIALSSPHNPTGRVWSPAEIRRLACAAASAGGVLISDEVHSDLLHPGHRHPVAVDAAGGAEGGGGTGPAARTVTVYSIGKTFNVSGLAEALLLVPSPVLRQRIVQAVEDYGFFPGARPLAALAQDVALEHGGPWLDGLVAYLTANRDLAVRRLRQAVPGLVACVPEASYLLWLDASGQAGAGTAGQGRPMSREALLRDCGLDLQDGSAFGRAGRGFLRLNFALPRPRLSEAVERLCRYAAERAGHREKPSFRGT